MERAQIEDSNKIKSDVNYKLKDKDNKKTVCNH